VIGICFDRDDGVAGVNWPFEIVAGFDAHHVADLGHAEARGDVLAEGGGWCEHVAVAVGGLGDLRCQYGSERVRILGAGDREDFADAFDLGGIGGDGVNAVTKDQRFLASDGSDVGAERAAQIRQKRTLLQQRLAIGRLSRTQRLLAILRKTRAGPYQAYGIDRNALRDFLRRG